MYNDLKDFSSDTERKKVIRERITKLICECLRSEFPETTREIKQDIYVSTGKESSKIPKGSIICEVGEVLDKDKFPIGALVEINVKIKNWNPTSTAKRTKTAITLLDIDDEIKREEEREE